MLNGNQVQTKCGMIYIFNQLLMSAESAIGIESVRSYFMCGNIITETSCHRMYFHTLDGIAIINGSPDEKSDMRLYMN